MSTISWGIITLNNTQSYPEHLLIQSDVDLFLLKWLTQTFVHR